MNLLTLQICKEEAEKMIKDPHSWSGNYRLGAITERTIREQGRRTLEVIEAYEKRKEDARKRGIHIS